VSSDMRVIHDILEDYDFCVIRDTSKFLLGAKEDPNFNDKVLQLTHETLPSLISTSVGRLALIGNMNAN
jgi:hypothetical protein